MTATEIKEYLGALVELEKEKYMQEQLINSIKVHMGQLGEPEKIEEPRRENPKPSNSSNGIGGLAMLGALIGGIAGLFIFDNGFFGSLILGAVIGAVCLLIIGSIATGISDSKRDSYAQAEADRKYRKDCVEYKKRKEREEQRLQEEQRALTFLETEVGQLDASYTQTTELLDKLYGLNILYQKYHHKFPVIATLYEYFSSGRFTALEGPDGAYNQLELEIRLDRIITRLDIVINQLEAIKQNQFMIYSAISEANSKLDQLIESSNRIESGVRNLQLQGDELNARVAGLQATSDLNLYINALNHQELSYMRQYNLN